MIAKNLDTMILGCTHYPIIANMLKSVLSDKINLISSGKPLSKSLLAYLQKKNYLNMDKNPTTQFYVSDSSDKFKELGSRFLNDEISSIKTCKL